MKRIEFPLNIFLIGATGDLAKRKILPAIYNLYQKKDIIYNKIRFSAAFAIDALYVYQNTSDPAVRQALAEVIDSARNFAVSSADPKAGNWKKSMKTFDQEAGWLSTYYQEGLSDPQ